MVAKVLEQPTLVLNRNWQPVNVATVGRALVMLWNESALVVDPAPDVDAYLEVAEERRAEVGVDERLARRVALARAAPTDPSRR